MVCWARKVLVCAFMGACVTGHVGGERSVMGINRIYELKNAHSEASAVREGFPFRRIKISFL
jgi:hypothetical protein